MTRHFFLSTTVAVFFGMSALIATETTPLRKKELKSAIQNAKTAQDHQRIAAYYQKEAGRMLAEAKEHDDLALLYGKSPNPLAIRVGKSAEHCKYFAKAAREAAQASKELAKMHDEMAKEAQ